MLLLLYIILRSAIRENFVDISTKGLDVFKQLGGIICNVFAAVCGETEVMVAK
jgi:hypothetical protein